MRPDVTILATLHLSFMLLASLPWENAFLERYQWLTNTVQYWRMFYSAYTIHDQDYLVVSDGKVVMRAAPPRYLDPDPEGQLPIRIINHLGRLRNPGNEAARSAWFARISEEMSKREADSYTVEMRSERVRNFYYSRKDGVLFKELVNSYGPFGIEK